MKKIVISNVQNPVTNYKRRVANKRGFLADFKHSDLQKIYTAFYLAEEKCKEILRFLPPECRVRGFEAGTFNSCMIRELRKVFPENCKFWKYKRFVLDLNGYSILFKKLNDNGMPMNINTKSNSSILNQLQTTLFDPRDFEKPIVFFGWFQNKQGALINPNFVYIDESKSQWRVYEDELNLNEMNITVLDNSHSIERETVKLKDKFKKKKAN